MSRSQRALCLLGCLLCLSVTVEWADGSDQPASHATWRKAEAGWKYEFPRDHGPHHEFKTEWWYATGNLADAEGREFGFQLTFFREGIRPGGKPPGSSRFRVTELPFAHFAFTDVGAGSFRSFQLSSRGAFGEAGFGVPGVMGGKMAWMQGWVMEELPSGGFHIKADGTETHALPSRSPSRSIDLVLVPDREPLIHGKDGISPKSNTPGHASHYYSLTRMKATGRVQVEGRSHVVRGIVWFDHEWASNQLEPDQAGWDWSGLHLDNGDDLMLFRIRNKEGKEVFTAGTLREPSGTVTDIRDLTIRPRGTWRSPHSGGAYPSSWEITIPSKKLILSLSSKLADQELLLSPFAYWEGAVRGVGEMNGEKTEAEGYLEMTGYGGEILGLRGK